ncbi:right-handed parallel beta-helix repeat-containing protein, partial [Candidatus Pacearchaeota archaeon]|nr:right-handed parallel beta-helix repeat-containing protein [Candidatus Pacearchaeota archaeon]
SGTTDQQGGYAIEVPITISTIKYPPEAFALYNPGDTTPSDSYVIKWSKAAGATNYILDEALSNSFSSPDEIYSGTSTFKSITKTVDGTYYYRVKACNSDGCNESNIVNITKMNYPPNIPNNPAPQDSSINQPINPTLSWDGGDPNGDYVIYTVSLDSSSNPITEVCSTLTSCYISGLEHDTTYYWKVVASDGKLSETSPVWSFTTKPLTVCPSGCGYTSIQKAVYSAKKGDTIRVYSGIYFENVVINSLYNENYQITLKGIDSGGGMPVIDAGGTTKSALKLSGSQIEVDGFIITNATLGDSNYGIEVNSCSNCTINNNTVINNRRGIGVVFSNNVTLEGNVVNDNEYFGVSIIQSENNTIIDNTANNNSVYAYGIMISSSINNLIENNTFNDNSWYGIALNGGSNNNIITKNNINNNYQGIGLENSNDNIIFFNNFVDNSIDVKSTNSENMWNSTLKIRYILNNSIFNNYLGNYFSTYSDPDSNGDGIGDTSYGRENYPLFHQFEEYVIPILVCPSKCGHTSIQGAIYSAKIKDTIVVLSGIYNENVNVNKHITIWGLDTGGGKPVVDAGGTQNSAIKLSVDGITVKGLKVTNSTGYTGGIYITSKNNNVKDNDAIENYYGISIYSPGSNNTLMGNNIVNSSNGYGAGIYIWSNNNSIIMNTIKNYYYGNGMSVGNSKYNKIYGNNVSSNRNGIRLYWYSDYNTLIDNNASNNKYGISFEDSSFNTLQKNKVTSNNYGIYIENYLSNSNNNTLYQNNITENRDMFSEISNVFDEGNNNWDNGTIGNLYSDFDTSDEGCNDIDINGICDSNYSIPGGLNVDRYPIALWQNKDIIFPASIKNLKNTTYKQTYINWTWNNPSDSDFNYTMVYLNSTFVANVSEEFFNATGLNADTEYTIGTRTVDTTGNINATWVNHTARTKVKGDFNNNGRVDIGDVAKVAYMVVDKVADDMGADFNGNGRVDIGDAAKIAYYLVGKVSEL